MVQVALRADEVGFRDGAQKFVVLSTDAAFHQEGDYDWAPDGANDYDTVIEDEDYPARLNVEYSERLSRGLVLVKWILGIPHFLVVAVFQGGELGGLNSLLVLFAAVALLFSGRYPRDIFDLVLGINRWSYRVVVYALLMRDEYPPFRLEP
ncbi:MAG: DUF4389 domain-containing protein [SAR324 cluster bacterium]|nr:DUF4389 domain-containing protein [SAR324 cluster bacterium]